MRCATASLVLAIGLSGCSPTPTAPSTNPALVQQAGTSATTQPKAILWYESDRGDYIGQGQSAEIHLTGSQFEVTLNQSQSELHFRLPPDGNTWWDLYFETATGVLAPGLYEHATRWPFQLAGVAGLSFSGSGRGCNELTGRFLIATAQFSGTQVQRFHARFEQHCEGFSKALRGQIWIDASGAPPPFLPDFPAPPPGPATMFSYQSGPGDSVGQGRSGSYTLSGMKFLAETTPNRPGINVILSSDDLSVFWSASFAAASGTLLQPGSYRDATRFPFNSGVPGLSVSGTGGGCNSLRGSFIVHDVGYGPSGEVLRFHATFEQHCEGQTPALLGEVLIAADPWR